MIVPANESRGLEVWLRDGQICFKASVGSLARNGRVKVRRIQGERREKAKKGRKKNGKKGDRGGEEVVSKMALQENHFLPRLTT